MPRQQSALEVYRRKRDFSHTAEPAGAQIRARRGSRFVVQKHDARRLHYDLRLELDGVLKSWAVTRGPSLDPADRRLAVRTEDHPIEYRSFEGTIPKGAYGGGTVMLWDQGLWRPHGDPREGLAKGVLKFDLEGHRLKGGFALVRLSSKPRDNHENWLLIKERDAHAARDSDVTRRWEKSVATGRAMDDIAAARPRQTARTRARGRRRPASPGHRAKDAAAKDEHGPGPAHPVPEFIAPQLASLAPEPPEGADWLHEIKFDGYRLIATVAAGKGVRLYTRSGLDWTGRFPGIAAALAKLPVRSCILDGEVVAADDNGRSDFGRLQHILKGAPGDLVYWVFDLLHLDGRSLRNRPLHERKKLLAGLLKHPPDGVRLSGHIAGHGVELFRRACAMKIEGIISKRRDAPYVSGRSGSWVKIKCFGRDEFVVGGYRASSEKHRPFSSLLLGEYRDGRLVYRGRVGTGFSDEDRERLDARLAALRRHSPPFEEVPRGIARDARWVAPQLVAEIAYTERTADGVLRHPRFLGLREDKRAAEVRMQKVPAKARPAKSAMVAGVQLSHPGKVFFPEAGLTKADLAGYYFAASPHMLPHVRNRPLSLVRCPDGTEMSGRQSCFFQKHRTPGLPAPLGSVTITESSGKKADYIALRTAAGLVAAAQVGALEIHVWGSTTDAIERPIRMVFDLDPDQGMPFAAVREAARDVRDLLLAAGLRSFPLVTGGKGIHVVVPIERRHDWNEVKAFAKGLATQLAQSEPGRFVATMSKALRKGRIFIDWLRNERGATAIAPYSPRARPHAPVAMPVSWPELARIERADAFTMRAALGRIEKATDPWDGYFSTRQRLGTQALRFFAK